jgi:hypothetical protein
MQSPGISPSIRTAVATFVAIAPEELLLIAERYQDADLPA